MTDCVIVWNNKSFAEPIDCLLSKLYNKSMINHNYFYKCKKGKKFTRNIIEITSVARGF